MDANSRFNYWLKQDSLEPDLRAELEAIAGDTVEINARFNETLDFGTSGLRGIMRAGTNAINLYTVAQATQALCNCFEHPRFGDGGRLNKVVLAYDSRHNSKEFALRACQVLAANGIDALIFDELRPTPELSYAVREMHAAAGINITASHNPAEYNGYKLYGNDGTQIDSALANAVHDEINKIDVFEDVRLASMDSPEFLSRVSTIENDFDNKYLSQVMACSLRDSEIKEALQEISIVYTPFHGAGYRLVPKILEKIGVKHLYTASEQMIPDGGFPTLASPNPESDASFELGIRYAEENSADLIIATDPDADRCRAAAWDGAAYRPLSGNQMAALMLDYILAKQSAAFTLPESPVVIRSIVSSPMIDKICEFYGVTLVKVLTGFKHVGSKMTEYAESGEFNFVFAFEESIGFLPGDYARDKDGVAATMLMAEVSAYYKSQDLNLYQGLERLYTRFGYYQERVVSKNFPGINAISDMRDKMHCIRENSPRVIGYPVLSVTDYLSGQDGLEPSDVLEFHLEGGTTLLLRPSGTEPKIKAYILARGNSSGESDEILDTIHNALSDLL